VQYLYHKDAGIPSITLEGDDHRYLFKVRRHKEGDSIALRHLRDDSLYHYTIISIDKRSLTLTLRSQESLGIEAGRKLHLGWCLIDPKNIEKVLPTLNELGVAKISFIYCDRSQKNFKPDIERLEKILLNSSQQCGRSSMIELETIGSLREFKQRYPQSSILHFSENRLDTYSPPECVVVGCEGGFSENEVKLFGADEITGLATPMILKSESAVMTVSAIVLA